MGLRCRIQKKFAETTDSDHKKPIAENLLNREFNPKRPTAFLVGDITYLRVGSHWEYLSVFIDLYSRKVVGWNLSRRLTADSTCNAFGKFLYRYNRPLKESWFIVIVESNMYLNNFEPCLIR